MGEAARQLNSYPDYETRPPAPPQQRSRQVPRDISAPAYYRDSRLAEGSKEVASAKSSPLLLPARLLWRALNLVTGRRPWLAAIVVFGFGINFLQSQILGFTQQLTAGDQKIEQLHRANSELKSQIAVASNPEELVNKAKSLGMSEPDPNGVQFLSGSAGANVTSSDSAATPNGSAAGSQANNTQTPQGQASP